MTKSAIGKSHHVNF